MIWKYITLLFLPVTTALPLIINVESPKQLLSEPESYDWGYKYDDDYGDYEYKLYQYGHEEYGEIVGYNRTADGQYYNYVSGVSGAIGYGFSDFNILPDGLDIQLTFNHSNTIYNSGGGGAYYYPKDIKIGSDNSVGTISKVIYDFNNDTKYDYLLYLDRSSSGTSRVGYYEITSKSTGQQFYYNSYIALNRFLIPAYSTSKIYFEATSEAVYFDAFYLKDLGISDSYSNGSSDGYSDGYSEGYSEGSSEGYLDGYSVGESYGYSSGYNNGYSDAIEFNSGYVTVGEGIGEILSSTASFFAIEVIPGLGITIGALIFAPIVFGILFMILKKIK